MNREQFFQELRTALHREGFVPQPEQDELLPVEWDGLPLCRITADGGVRYWQEDVVTPERERACERATDLACTVREYMTLLEQAPPLQAQSSTFTFKDNPYSTYNRPTHFTPIWYPDGSYTPYTWLLDCWTPAGMLSLNLTDSVRISGDLWEDWHIAPTN